MSEAAARVRADRRRWAVPGSSHDSVIAVARLGLPAAIGVLAAFLAIAPLTSGKNISFVLAKDRVDMARERMRVTRAVYKGEDGMGRHFAITANSAVQATSAVPIVRLDTLAARLEEPEGPSTLVAPAGRYDMDTQKLAVDGAVDYRTADGYHIETRDVLIDLDKRLLAGDRPIAGTMPLGRFSADRVRADLGQRVVVLEGRARLHIVQRAGRAAR